MLSAEKLIELYRHSQNERVLSVYLDASQTDPAARSAWHTRFRDNVRELRRGLGEGSPEASALEGAVARLSEVLGDGDSFLQGRGWIGFATENEVIYGEGVPVPMPNLVRWEDGIRVAPYLRALKQSRPIVVGITDSRRTRLFRYLDGQFDEFIDLRADQDFGELNEGASSRRPSSSTGVRGATARDKSQTLKEVETARMLEDAAQRLTDEAGAEGTVVLGGVESAVAQLRKALPSGLDTRVAVRPKLSFDLPEKDILTEIEEAASEVSAARQAGLVEHVFDLALSGGSACIGRLETERAIEERRVKTLVVSASLRKLDPDGTDWMVGRSFEGGASAIEVSGNAATRLDDEASGVGALLHYRVEAPSSS